LLLLRIGFNVQISAGLVVSETEESKYSNSDRIISWFARVSGWLQSQKMDFSARTLSSFILSLLERTFSIASRFRIESGFAGEALDAIVDVRDLVVVL
jgi:hypothetical protein